MSTLRKAWRIDNLRRAWRWIRSNPDRNYKNYFRSLYSAYATTDEALLKHLKNRLDRQIYDSSDACKIFFPKPSGILRPYTLICLEDQIVYQAMANVIAEHLHPHVRGRYNKSVFGHQYAGSSSLWFYKKWTHGYRAFNTAAENAFDSGHTWSASFDLTAFYDSIDHNVLSHVLQDIGLDEEFCTTLASHLNRWSATDTQIYHNHGIPQGPLSSGLVSEAVLKHFDENFKTKFDVVYLRYVDDIRLFAKSERHLRHALVLLDRLSKDVGLFPQSGKIDIHEVTDIRKELKSTSNPPEPALSKLAVDQPRLRRRIAELAPRSNGYHPTDTTRFKFLLSKAAASVRVLDRLWRVFDANPHLYPQLVAFLGKFDSLPDKQADNYFSRLKSSDLYSAIRAGLVAAPSKELLQTRVKRFRSNFKPLWKVRSGPAELTDSLWPALHQLSHMTERQADYALLSTKVPWVQMRMHFGIPWFSVTTPRAQRLLNQTIRSPHADVAIAAGWIAALLTVQIDKPIRTIHPLAKLVLRESGVLKRADASVCGIELAELEMCGRRSGVTWKRFFGKNYKHAESKIVACKGYFKTDPTAWVSMLDVFNDLLLDELFKRNAAIIGSRELGNFGAVIFNKRLEATFPKTYAYVCAVHQKRGEGELAHAVVKATKAPTGRIPYKWRREGIKHFVSSSAELAAFGY